MELKWKGNLDQDLVFTLTDDERDRLLSKVSEIEYDQEGCCSYITDLQRIAFSSIPKRLLNQLRSQRTSLNPKPYIIIENLPLDRYVRTTGDGKSVKPKKSGQISENLMMLFASLLGEPYSISFEGNEVVNNLIPYPQNQDDYTGLGSGVELDFHIENAALKYLHDGNLSPQGLLLTGVREDQGNPYTYVSDARQALSMISNESKEQLKKPLYKLKVPHRWRGITKAENTEYVSVICESDTYPEVSVAFYPDMILAKTEEAKKALEELHVEIKRCSVGVVIEPGMLIYIDNRFALHSRDKFESSQDEMGFPSRWVQRIFVASNLWNHRRLSNIKKRVFEPGVEEL